MMELGRVTRDAILESGESRCARIKFTFHRHFTTESDVPEDMTKSTSPAMQCTLGHANHRLHADRQAQRIIDEMPEFTNKPSLNPMEVV